MINRRIYLGIPMSSRRNRRALVAGYWSVSVLLLICATILFFDDPRFLEHWWMAITIGLLVGLMLCFLGGGAQLGPVADFDGDPKPPPRWALIEAADRLIYRWKHGEAEQPLELNLDERDRRLRDHAHYRAYRILRMILQAAIIAGVLLFTRPDAWTLLRRYNFVLVPFSFLLILLLWNLPQSIILWNEPDMEEPR